MRLHRAAWLPALLVLAAPNRLAAQQTEWPDPVANDVIPYQSSGLTHGPMLGAPGATSMRVWVRTGKPARFRVLYDSQLPLDSGSPAVEGTTQRGADNTGVVELSGLEPATRYYYGIAIDGQLADTRLDFHDPWPSFRTLPGRETFADSKNNPRGLFDLCFSVGCCASQEPVKSGGHYGSSPSFATLLREHGGEVMFHVMNGDYIYEELRDGTFDGYRANYRRYLERGRSRSRLLRHVPFLFTFDDHETGGDVQGPGEVGVLRSGPWLARDLSMRPWHEYCGWANFSQSQNAPPRYGEASTEASSRVLFDKQADFSTLRPETVSTIHVWKGQKNAGIYGLVKVLDKHRLQVEPAFPHTEECKYSVGAHNYFSWKLGNCHFFALDTRGERSGFRYAERREPDRFILGAAQRKWLIEGVRESDADFIFIISSVPWTVFHTAAHVRGMTKASLQPKGDSFGGYLHEREQLLTLFDKLDKPVLIFTGDVHNAMSIQVTDNVWEFLCGPMNSTGHPIGTAGNPPLGGWFDSEGRRVKVKWVAGSPNNVHYSRLRSKFYAVVQVNNLIKAARPQGAGYQWVAYDAPQVVVRFHDGHRGRLVYAEGISRADVERQPPSSD